MTPKQACQFPMPFGQYEGKTLEQIATTDPDGPRYLDWMVGNEDLSDGMEQALKTFLAIPWVVELVNRAVESRKSRSYSEPVENLRTPRPWWKGR